MSNRRTADKPQTKRKVLGTLQSDAKDPLKLVGTHSCPGSPNFPQKKYRNTSGKRSSVGVQVQPNVQHKETQTEMPPEASIHYRMCTEPDPPKEYWELLAEKRREALAQTLAENEQLYDEIEKLKAALRKQELAEDDSRYFAFLYKLATSDEV